MTSILPWARGPFELLVHAEVHLRQGGDFDRRIALISLDNAIEVAITTYLTLKPIHRGGRSYNREKVTQWLHDYYTKLDFLECELNSRQDKWAVDRTHILWAHTQRNEQYHGGNSGIPEKSVIDIARKAALWVFSFLFEVTDVETELENEIQNRSAAQETPPQEDHFDEAIDLEYGIIEIGEQSYLASELLYAMDYTAYLELGEELNSS